MANSLPIHLFMDYGLVDELWTILKRDGTVVEKISEASAKIAGKTSFGVGDIWKWIAADLTAEISAEGSGKYAEKIQYTSIFRALLLRELIPAVSIIDSSNLEDIAELQPDAFVQVSCDQVDLVPLPTFASYTRQILLDSVDSTDGEPSQSVDSKFSYVDKYTVSERAFGFVHRLDDDRASSPLRRLWSSNQAVIGNALSMSNNDHVLAVGSLIDSEPEVLIFSVLKEDGLRRNLGAYAGGRPLVFFGQVALIHQGKRADLHVGVMPLSIALG